MVAGESASRERVSGYTYNNREKRKQGRPVGGMKHDWLTYLVGSHFHFLRGCIRGGRVARRILTWYPHEDMS